MPRDKRAKQRMARRRRRAALLAILLFVFCVGTVKLIRNGLGANENAIDDAYAAHTAESSQSPPPSPSPSASPESDTPESPTPSPTVVESGNGKWDFAAKPDKKVTFGDKGQTLTYNVAVEGETDADLEEFSDLVANTLADERSWTAEGEWRFQPTGEGNADFTVYLASPNTRADLCGAEDTYTSCRNGNSVVINLERWIEGVPHWEKSLQTYRQYVINHEVGHRLGKGHVECAKEGEPSPVMAQQTVELRGCEENPWPYVDGEYVDGPPGEYL